MSRFPSIPESANNQPAVHRAVAALIQTVQLLTGARGTGELRAITAGEAAVVGPVRLPEVTLQQLPPATEWRACMMYVTDGASNQHVVVSDGLVWRYQDGTAV